MLSSSYLSVRYIWYALHAIYMLCAYISVATKFVTQTQSRLMPSSHRRHRQDSLVLSASVWTRHNSLTKEKHRGVRVHDDNDYNKDNTTALGQRVPPAPRPNCAQIRMLVYVFIARLIIYGEFQFQLRQRHMWPFATVNSEQYSRDIVSCCWRCSVFGSSLSVTKRMTSNIKSFLIPCP